jgi:hypothetical protein
MKKLKNEPGHIPINLIIPTADTQLYRIGLQWRDLPNNGTRNLLHHPLIIHLFLWVYAIKTATTLFARVSGERLYVILGDFPYLMHARPHIDVTFIDYCVITITYQLIFYFNYARGISPTFMTLFNVLAGKVSPTRVGLNDRGLVDKWAKQAGSLFRINTFVNQKLMPFLGLFSLAAYLNHRCSLSDILTYGVPNSLHLAYVGYLNHLIPLWLLVHFYVICLYLKYKIRVINGQLVTRLKKDHRFDPVFIGRTICKLNGIYHEISVYNTGYWCKYLLTAWLLLGFLVIMGIYAAIFQRLNWANETILIFSISFRLIEFICIIFTASEVNYEANKTRKLFYSYVIKHGIQCYYNQNILYRNVCYKLKVGDCFVSIY